MATILETQQTVAKEKDVVRLYFNTRESCSVDFRNGSPVPRHSVSLELKMGTSTGISNKCVYSVPVNGITDKEITGFSDVSFIGLRPGGI